MGRSKKGNARTDSESAVQLRNSLLCQIFNSSTSKSSMFAARTSNARCVKRIARSFATVVDAAGVKVAAVDRNQPTASVTLFIKAGTRFETKEGVANALKNFAFKVSHSESLEVTLKLSVARTRRRRTALRLEPFGRASCTAVFCIRLSTGNTLR